MSGAAPGGDAASAPEGGGGRTVLELLSLAAEHLARKGVPSARREADALLGHVLGCDRLHLYLRFEERPSPADVGRFRELTRRRAGREPLQYLTGRCRFLELELACDRRALIPRPETEELAGLARGLPGVRERPCADIGTGTGCLALALAARGSGVLATDRSAEALALARSNAEALGLGAKVRFAQGDLYRALGGERGFGLIVSNPPYIPAGERGTLQPEVGLWEPAEALFAGPRGLDVLEPLLDGAPAHLAPGGWLALECGPGQAAELAERARASGDWTRVEAREDGFGKERFLVCGRA